MLLTEALLSEQANTAIQSILTALGIDEFHHFPPLESGWLRKHVEERIRNPVLNGTYELHHIREYVSWDTLQWRAMGADGTLLVDKPTVVQEGPFQYRILTLPPGAAAVWCYRFTPRFIPTPTVNQRLTSEDLQGVLLRNRCVLEELGGELRTLPGFCEATHYMVTSPGPMIVDMGGAAVPPAVALEAIHLMSWPVDGALVEAPMLHSVGLRSIVQQLPTVDLGSANVTPPVLHAANLMSRVKVPPPVTDAASCAAPALQAAVLVRVVIATEPATETINVAAAFLHAATLS